MFGIRKKKFDTILILLFFLIGCRQIVHRSTDCTQVYESSHCFGCQRVISKGEGTLVQFVLVHQEEMHLMDWLHPCSQSLRDAFDGLAPSMQSEMHLMDWLHPCSQRCIWWTGSIHAIRDAFDGLAPSMQSEMHLMDWLHLCSQRCIWWTGSIHAIRDAFDGLAPPVQSEMHLMDWLHPCNRR